MKAKTVRSFLSSTNKSAPVWMQNTIAALAILLASKGILIDAIPGMGDSVKVLIGEWFEYITNWIAIVFAIITIFSQSKNSHEV